MAAMLSIGVDSHKDSLAASAVDELGVERAVGSFANTRAGHRQLRAWLPPGARRIGIEGSAGFGAALAQSLLAAGELVLEVPPQLTVRERRHARRPGKSDPADALAIARITAREQRLRVVQAPALSDELKLLVTAREELVAERIRHANQLHADLVVLRPGYGARLPHLRGSRQLAIAGRLLGSGAHLRCQLARRRLARLRRLDAEIAGLERQIAARVRASRSSLPGLTGVAALLAASLLAESGDVRRFRSAAAFAAASGTAPIPASSGQHQRHRLNRGGNRRLNRALHAMALVQARCDPRARAYLARRRAEGKTWREAMRALKRQLADVVFRTMLADARAADLTI
jgi:transposase